jgi:hypothetical protein
VLRKRREKTPRRLFLTLVTGRHQSPSALQKLGTTETTIQILQSSSSERRRQDQSPSKNPSPSRLRTTLWHSHHRAKKSRTGRELAIKGKGLTTKRQVSIYAIHNSSNSFAYRIYGYVFKVARNIEGATADEQEEIAIFDGDYRDWLPPQYQLRHEQAERMISMINQLCLTLHLKFLLIPGIIASTLARDISSLNNDWSVYKGQEPAVCPLSK